MNDLKPLQDRIAPWVLACFGPEIAADKVERNHRFLEEALELVQSTGCTKSEALQLVDYVYGRDIGDPPQEVGGVMITLGALCLAQGLDMHECGETELARIWTKVEQIRAKQAAKPKNSPLPMCTRTAPTVQEAELPMTGLFNNLTPEQQKAALTMTDNCDLPGRVSVQEAAKVLLAKVEAGSATAPEFQECLGRDALNAIGAFNGSLDAAKDLHDAVLPGWMYGINFDANDEMYALVGDGAHFETDECYSDTHARAWLIAIIKALIAIEGQKA